MFFPAPATAWIAAAVCTVGAILACRGLEKAEECLRCLATVSKDAKIFSTRLPAGLDDLVDELSPFGYRPSATEN